VSVRLRTFDNIGFHRYFLTICTRDRSRVFIEANAVASYCFMPDHVHAFVEGIHEASDFTHFVRIFKQESAFHWRRTTGRILWHRSYFDRVLRDHADTMSVVRYILENPVRAGLVTQPQDYPYLGSMTGTVADLLCSVQMR
jgi:hypothetical protein